MYATELISRENFLEAVHVFEKYGAAANVQNFNTYKKLIDQVINAPDCGYQNAAALRNMILRLNENIETSQESVDARVVQVRFGEGAKFEIAHRPLCFAHFLNLNFFNQFHFTPSNFRFSNVSNTRYTLHHYVWRYKNTQIRKLNA